MRPILEFIVTEFHSLRAREHIAAKLELLAKEIRNGQREVTKMMLENSSENEFPNEDDEFLLTLKFKSTESGDTAYSDSSRKQVILH